VKILRQETAMAKRESPTGCPMDALLRLLMGPWTTYVLWVLRSEGPTRFGALKRAVAGVSAKMLTERLRLLEAAGIVSRDYAPTIPPQVTYALTARGVELSAVFASLDRIARAWQKEDERLAKAKPSRKKAA
jgi:DNA-binding HxlR family transcriptional regulator